MVETNGTANTCWGGTLKLEDLKRLEREIAAMPRPPWTLIAPDGRAWQDVDPQKLLRVLALACYPLMGTAGVQPSQAQSTTDEQVQRAGERLSKLSERERGYLVLQGRDGHERTCGVAPVEASSVTDEQLHHIWTHEAGAGVSWKDMLSIRDAICRVAASGVPVGCTCTDGGSGWCSACSSDGVDSSRAAPTIYKAGDLHFDSDVCLASQVLAALGAQEVRNDL